jgi:hypothetical protein
VKIYIKNIARKKKMVSEENKSPEETTVKPTSDDKLKTDDSFDEMYEKVIVNIVLVMSLIGIAGLAIGIVWFIKDLISTDVWTEFKGSSIQTIIFVIGIILIGIFFMFIFLFVLYKRGIHSISDALFKKKPSRQLKEGEEYLAAKIITAGALLSIFVIFVGLLIASIQWMIAGFGTDISDFWDSFAEFKGGYRVLIVSALILVLDGLIFGFIYVWMNGQGLLVNNIMNYNRKVIDRIEFSKGERIAGKFTFGLIVTEICLIIGGLIWSLIDAIFGTSIFADPSFGIQFSFIGIASSFLFTTLIGVMFLYKRGLNLVMSSLFVKITPNKEKVPTMAKIITVGFLSGIVLAVVGLVIWIISLIVTALSDSTSDTNFLQDLADLSGGLSLFAYGLIAFVFTVLALIFSFFLHNGYYFTMDKILKIEEKIGEGLDDISKKKAK